MKYKLMEFHRIYGDCHQGSRFVMARKYKDIKIVVHTAECMDNVYNSKEAFEFWVQSAIRKLNQIDKYQRKEVVELCMESLGTSCYGKTDR